MNQAIKWLAFECKFSGFILSTGNYARHLNLFVMVKSYTENKSVNKFFLKNLSLVNSQTKQYSNKPSSNKLSNSSSKIKTERPEISMQKRSMHLHINFISSKISIFNGMLQTGNYDEPSVKLVRKFLQTFWPSSSLRFFWAKILFA